MIERTVGIHQDLLAFAAYPFEFRHYLPEIGGRQGEQEPIAEPDSIERSYALAHLIPIVLRAIDYHSRLRLYLCVGEKRVAPDAAYPVDPMTGKRPGEQIVRNAL